MTYVDIYLFYSNLSYDFFPIVTAVHIIRKSEYQTPIYLLYFSFGNKLILIK